MTKDDWSELAAALAESWKYSGVQAASTDVRAEAQAFVPVAASTETAGAAVEAYRIGRVQSAAIEPPQQAVETIVRRAVDAQSAAETRRAENQRPFTATRSTSSSQQGSGSVAGEVLKTAGMITGVGPLVTGLIKLFGGGSDDKATSPAAPMRYELPSALRVDAGLMSNRSVSEISYAQNHAVRADQNAGERRELASHVSAPAIQIQVNAMDSRSFMDHSDEIAQAVRAAMLRSHALNDVVSEV